MGREIKRVPVGFDWPLRHIWKGYWNPYDPLPCRLCDPDGSRGQGDGMSPEARAINLSLYDRRWTFRPLTADDVAYVLADDYALRDYKGPPEPEAVNAWLRTMDPIWHGFPSLAWVLTKARCERQGVPHQCRLCDGEGEIWPSEEFKRLSEEHERIDPPAGDGWQLWETVSEGSPITPALATAEELARWCFEHQWDGGKRLSGNERWNGLAGGTNELSYEQWLKFIAREGSAFSMVFDLEKGPRSGVEEAIED